METQQDFIESYLHNRRRSTAFFDMLTPEAYLRRPIRLRNPVVFYEGHLPAFSANTLLKKGFGYAAIDQRLDHLFERGIDPVDEASAHPRVNSGWPVRSDVLAYGFTVDAAIVDAMSSDEFGAGKPRLANMAHTILEHEAMHQETLLYLWHELGHHEKAAPPELDAVAMGPGANPPVPGRIPIPAGIASIGAAPGSISFGWDNEFPQRRLDVPAFEIDCHNVSNRDFMAFVEAGAYGNRQWWSDEAWLWLRAKSITHPHFWCRQGNAWAWRGMFSLIDLPPEWPVYVSHAEAAAYARWCGARLPTEAEYHRAAFGTPDGEERPYPWGSAPPDPSRGNFDFARWEPAPVGSFPAGASAWGVHDLVGNGWEWTATRFAAHPGFCPMEAYPEYSADFFDDRHYVLKGASPATAKELIRPSFRNWFRETYPYVYATFRTVVPAGA